MIRPNKKRLVNPNWAVLQQNLKNHRPHKPTLGENRNISGKRKRVSDLPDHSDSQENPLIPVNGDFSVTDTIAMDCEMVGVGNGSRSALARVTLINQWGNVLYDEFVKPLEHVVDFRTRISGVRPHHMRIAKDFTVVQYKVADLIKGRTLVGHALQNDLKALLLSHPKKDIRDTSKYKPFLGGGKRKALKHLASELLGVTIQNGEHCPIEDARAAMALYQRNKNEWEKSLKHQISSVYKSKQKKMSK